MEPDYEFTDLTNRLYSLLEGKTDNNKQDKLKIMPKLATLGNKTKILNFNSICQKLAREPTHMMKYFSVELSTDCNLNEENELIITRIFKENAIVKVLTNYVDQFVKCKICDSYNTELLKDNRITFIKCLNCNSKQSISSA